MQEQRKTVLHYVNSYACIFTYFNWLDAMINRAPIGGGPVIP